MSERFRQLGGRVDAHSGGDAKPLSAARRGAKLVGLFFVSLVIWWAVNTHLLAYGVYTTWKNYQFALALSLFFGSLTAIPTVAYLLFADFLAGKLRFPLSSLAFVGLAACGGALLLGLDYSRGLFQFQSLTSEGGYFYYRQRFWPPVAVAGFLLVLQIVKSIRAEANGTKQA